MKSATRTPVAIPRRRGRRASQRGLGLLVVLVVAGVLAVVLVGNAMVGQRGAQVRTDATRDALARAKEALIAYAVGRMDHTFDGLRDMPGRLPCPAIWPPTETNPEGSTAPLGCGDQNATVVGHLPWRTLGIPVPRDGAGECLWYVVSGRFKHAPRSSDIFNWDTEGQIRVLRADGSLVADRVAAVIIAPGPALDQTRATAAGAATCPGSYVPADYLEADHGASNHTMATNASPAEPATSVVIDGGIDPATGRERVNDRIVIITTAELVEAAARRKDYGVRPLPNVTGSDLGRQRLLTYAVALCLARYAGTANANDRRLPWAGAREQPFALTQTAPGAPIASTPDLLAGRAPSAMSGGPLNGGDADRSFGNTAGTLLQHDGGSCNAQMAPVRSAWDQWRDHLYYAVSPDYTPDIPRDNATCGGDAGVNRCLRVNGSPARYAAIVIFAGRRLTGQNRPQWSAASPTPLPVRETYANYLENPFNLENIAAAPRASAPPDPAGLGYSYRSDLVATSTQDDFAYCVEVGPSSTDVAVVTPCP